MTQSAPKRYAHALIRHFVIFALFLPAFYSGYQNEYYQDLFITNIISVLFILTIWGKWTINLKRNLDCIIGITAGIVLYIIANQYIFRQYSEYYFWKNYVPNVVIAFVLFLTLLSIKDYMCIFTDKFLRFTIGAILLTNLIAIAFRLQGYSRIRFMNLTCEKYPVNPDFDHYSWLYYDYSEYALILLVCMAFFMVYRSLFKKVWIYALSQLVLLVGLCLTKSSTFLLAAGIMFGCDFVHFLLKRFRVKRKYVLCSLPVALILGCVLLAVLFTQVESFHTKYLIWKGNWQVILDNPPGLSSSFGALLYDIENVALQQNQAHNVFLNHMLRYSLPVGLVYTLMYAIIVVCSFIRHPNYRTLGIWGALLLTMNMEYSLQTMNLPFMLFMIYCLFFRTNVAEKERGESN